MGTNYKHKIIYAFLLILSASFGCSVEDEELMPEDGLRQELESAAKAGEAASDVRRLSDRYIIISASNSIPAGLKSQIGSLNGRVTKIYEGAGLATATSTDPDFITKASSIKGVSAVVHDFKIQWIDPSKAKGVKMEATYGNPPNSGDDDFFFDLQWGHDAIDAPEAWNAGYMGKGARVAVLDTGFDLTHPDLEPNIDFAASTSFVPGEDLQYNLSDTFSHGTHVAGTIAASDNGFGTIGVAPEAELILVKVLSDEGSGSFSWIMDGIVYAADQGADVINMSIGAYLPRNGKFLDEEGNVVHDTKAVNQLLNAINKVITYAYQQGATVVTSAGNDAVNGNKDQSWVHIPSDAPHAISISATAPRGWALNPYGAFLDYPASYTNYGTPEVDLAAPGGDVSYPGEEEVTIGFVTAPAYVFDLVFSTGNGGWYWSGGTSMATPHASGVAALIVGKNGGEMNPAQVEAILRTSAEDLGKPGRDPYYGHGRVNAYYAVTGKKVPALPAKNNKPIAKGKSAAKGKLVAR
ncbi:S8 family peptidase [Pontibacter russatus]|uniref:S8 family peptidase n=1 Tax=Pontibacter russatus TaxID=2694929 RepID=UPI00137B4FD7|nr:S8 family serine peptidase [Pontibacter russatus]